MDTGGTVESARRFVSEQDFGIIDECTRYGDSLHLSPGKLIGTFIKVIAEPYSLQSVGRAFFAFGFGTARDRQSELDIFKDGLMRNEVIGLKHKPNAVISVYVPIAVGIILGGDAANDEVSGSVVVEPADDVEKSRFSAAGSAQNGDEFIGAEFERHAFQSMNDAARSHIILFDVFEF